MKTNKEIIKAFVNNKSQRNTNMYSNGDKLFNYETCIAQRLTDGTIVVNSTKYSKTTSIIQTLMMDNIKNYKEVTKVPINTKDLTNYLK